MAAVPASTVRDAVAAASDVVGPEGLVVVLGSLYLAAEVRSIVGAEAAGSHDEDPGLPGLARKKGTVA
jgi:hypothetical protein